MVASRPTVMAPPRSHAPPRAFIAHFNAQKMANARLKDASGSRLTLRSKTAQARRSLTATQELRDTFATIDMEGTPGIRSSPARARTARTRPGRATDGEVARRIGPTSALALCVCAKRAVPRFPTFHAFSTSISAFRETRDCAARRKTLGGGIGKIAFSFSRKKKESSLLLVLVFLRETDGRAFEFSVLFPRHTRLDFFSQAAKNDFADRKKIQQVPVSSTARPSRRRAS
jgi:hypothetical protein